MRHICDRCAAIGLANIDTSFWAESIWEAQMANGVFIFRFLCHTHACQLYTSDDDAIWREISKQEFECRKVIQE